MDFQSPWLRVNKHKSIGTPHGYLSYVIVIFNLRQRGMQHMNNYVNYGYPQAYASFPAPPYYRNGEVQCKENMVLPNYVMYKTVVEPKFIEHLCQHIGLMIVISTTVGKLVGTLGDVFIDHVALVVDGKTHHIRIREIVYFEKAVEK